MSLPVAVADHLAALAARNFAPSTITARAAFLTAFARWCAAHAVSDCLGITETMLAAYRAHLAAAGAGRSPAVQRKHVSALRCFGAWLVRDGRVAQDPAASLTLPKLPQRLPAGVLSLREAERVLRRPRTGTPLGERDRAILELLYSSGLRRAELLALDVGDLDRGRQLLVVRRGKGGRDRLAPVGRRAAYWLRRYLAGARRTLLRGVETPALFVGQRGTRLSRTRVNERLRRYLDEAHVTKPGSCHIWRHTMATVMHDRGADVRDLQMLLGHAQLSTTAIYTHVSAARLLHVHRRTHPAWALAGDEDDGNRGRLPTDFA